MKYGLVILVVLAGVGIPIQVAMNNKLREAVQSPPAAVALAFLIGSLAMAVLAASKLMGSAQWDQLGSAPWWAWGGGLFSVAAVIISVIALPQAGAGAVVAGTVFGQLSAAMALDHFGWLGMDKSPINASKIGGALLLFAGALLMQRR